MHGGEKQGDGEPARPAGGVGEFLGGFAQGGGGLVVGASGGAAGAVERLGRRPQFCPVWAGRGAGDVVQGIAEGDQVALGGGIVTGVEGRVRRVYCGGGGPPWLGGIRRKADPWSTRTSWTGPGGPPARRPAYRRAPDPTPLRHHYASLLIKHGESVKTVSERLGHTNAAMTLNIYTHLWPDSEERTRAAVDKAYADQSADAQPQVDEAA